MTFKNLYDKPSKSLLLDFLNKPSSAADFNNQHWTLLIRTAKACKLLAHVAWVIDQHNLNSILPEKVKNQFIAALKIAEFRQRQTLWEINRLRRALKSFDATVIVLKGGAYLLLKLPFAKGRLLSDVDIMVKKANINNIEQMLLEQLWESQKVDEYDQHYYRQWMHEIPPLSHPLRAVEVDIHHTIIPPTSKFKPDPNLLFTDAIKVDDINFKVLSPCDMVLHSAVHLFSDSDLGNKLRDLVDLDQLFRHFVSQNTNFQNHLFKRARELGLQRPLYYTFKFTHQFLGTPLTISKQEISSISPPFPVSWLMNTLVPLALLPENPNHHRQSVRFARWLLYIRSHYLRMPLRLLLPHLARKSLMRIKADED